MKKIGSFLRRKRNLLNLTQEKLAKKIKISRQALNAIECNRSVPTLPVAKKIADFFQIDLNNLIEGKEEKMRKRDDWFSWSPFGDVDFFDRLIPDSFLSVQPMKFLQPRVDMYEKGNELVIEAELPGVEKKDVNIEFTEDAVKIEGEKKGEMEVKTENYYKKESRSGSFSRVLSFPFPVEIKKAKATFKDGQLRITIPKVAGLTKKVIKIKPE